MLSDARRGRRRRAAQTVSLMCGAPRAPTRTRTRIANRDKE